MCRHEIVEREKMSTMVVKIEMKTRKNSLGSKDRLSEEKR